MTKIEKSKIQSAIDDFKSNLPLLGEQDKINLKNRIDVLEWVLSISK